MRPSAYPIDDHNSCDCCHTYLANCRLIAGGVHDRRQFCSFACYDRWRDGKAPEQPSTGGQAASYSRHAAAKAD